MIVANVRSFIRLWGSRFRPQRSDRAGNQTLAPGYYVRTSAGAPALLAPTAANYVALTTKMDDTAPTDPDGHTTFESQDIGGLGTQGSIEILLHFGSPTLCQTTALSIYYGGGATCPLRYWDGAAWQTWVNSGLPPNLGDAWQDIVYNPADQTTTDLLLVLNESGDGANVQIRVGNWLVA